MFEFVFTSLNFLDNNTLSQPVVFLFSCCNGNTATSLPMKFERFQTEYSIYLKLVCSAWIFCITVCFKTVFARAEMKR